jgi:hypothetical protein
LGFVSIRQYISLGILQGILAAIFFCLSYANFKQLRITWRQWLRNGLILLAVVFGPPTILALLVHVWVRYWWRVL